METKISEIADGIYRLSTFVPDIAPPAGFTFNQFLVMGDEPLMFHTGLRKMFGLNRDALSRIIAPERLRRHFGFMRQDASLFDGALRDAICFGLSDVGQEEFARVVQLAGVQDFAARHPAGYGLRVGPRGERLSGSAPMCPSATRCRPRSTSWSASTAACRSWSTTPACCATTCCSR